MNINTYGLIEFVAILIYASIFVFGTIGFVLYYLAYFRMKKTPIIGSVCVLMIAIALDGGWWMLTEFIRFIGNSKEYIIWMVHPATLILIKSLLFVATINFVVTSCRGEDSLNCFKLKRT